MRRRVGLVILVIFCILMQMSFLPALRPFDVVPNIALVLVVLVGLEGTASLALIIAVAGGVALDFAGGANFGLWTGILVLAALGAGLLHREGLELRGGTVAAGMVALGTFLMAVVTLLGLVSTVSDWPLTFLAGHFTMELMLNLILMIGLRPVLRWVLPPVHGQVTIA